MSLGMESNVLFLIIFVLPFTNSAGKICPSSAGLILKFTRDQHQPEQPAGKGGGAGEGVQDLAGGLRVKLLRVWSEQHSASQSGRPRGLS